MEKMRSVLRSLMTAAGETAYDLQARAGIPQPTTYRFLNGSHGEPKVETIRKWAKAYGVTEAQLRGEEPIPDASMSDLFGDTLEAGQQPAGEEQQVTPRMAKRTATKQKAREERILAAEKRDMLALMNSMGKESRQALLHMGSVLSTLHQIIQQRDRRQNPERRVEQIEPNEGRRWGEQFRDPLVRSQHRRTDQDQPGERKQALKK